MGWQNFIKVWDNSSVFESLKKSGEIQNKYNVYEESINLTDLCSCFMAFDENDKFLIVTGGSYFDSFEGEIIVISGKKCKKCSLSNYNSKIIRDIFNFTNPVSIGDKKVSIGLGDRLGQASAGHLKLLKGKDVFPILAQQSIRELNLTGRTYDDVLSAAVWAVLQEGYREGFGADGDHLKTADEVNMALECGFTMITLDCSEYINNDIEGLAVEQVDDKYKQLDVNIRKYWEEKYKGKTFKLSGGTEILINVVELSAAVLIYSAAIDFAEEIFNNIIKTADVKVDFEISIDETLTPTNVIAHYIVASEFCDRGVDIQNMAPRFCGEFQKGIDYRGDFNQFTKEFSIHNAIAKNFGYRLSIHSGSDKFSVFPVIGRLTEGNFHIKTAGTNWLEAMRVIALEDTELFREMYRHSVKRLNDAKKYYHIYTERSMVPDENKYSDDHLENLLITEESRQALHVTYGYLLGDKDGNDRYLFRNRFFAVLHKYENTYYKCLEKHIGHHLEMLGL